MMTQDELKAHIKSQDKVVIELGCGPYKKPGVIGIDYLALDGVDYVADLELGLPFLEDNSVDEIISTHVLEHIENFKILLTDIHRVLKPNGLKITKVPYFSNPYYYSDYTHKRFFGLYSFDYFTDPKLSKYKRKVPSFYGDVKFEVLEKKIFFKSDFVIRNLFKQVLTRVFNVNTYMQELYEECFCYIFPCQEIKFTIRPIKSNDQEIS